MSPRCPSKTLKSLTLLQLKSEFQSFMIEAVVLEVISVG